MFIGVRLRSGRQVLNQSPKKQQKKVKKQTVSPNENQSPTQNPKTIKRHGRGIMFYKKGNAENMIKYVGDWKDDKFDGSGILELYGGAKYDGEWS